MLIVSGLTSKRLRMHEKVGKLHQPTGKKSSIANRLLSMNCSAREIFRAAKTRISVTSFPNSLTQGEPFFRVMAITNERNTYV